MSGYRFGITCPRCGVDVDHVSGGVVTRTAENRNPPYISVSSVVVFCTRCGRQWLVRAVIEPGPVTNASERQAKYRREHGVSA